MEARQRRSSSTAHTKCRRKSGPRSCTEVHRQYHNRSMVVVVRPTSRSEAATRRQRAHPPAGRERPPAGTRRVRAVAASDLVSTSIVLHVTQVPCGCGKKDDGVACEVTAAVGRIVVFFPRQKERRSCRRHRVKRP